MKEQSRSGETTSERYTKTASGAQHRVVATGIVRNTWGKYAMNIKMNLPKEAEQKVMWMADQHMAYYNLLPMMVQHWSYAHELNSYLIEVVQFLSHGCSAEKRPLNPLAPEYIYTKNETSKCDESKCHNSPTEDTINKEEKVIILKQILTLLDGYDFGWKIPSKNVVKSTQYKPKITKTTNRNSNRFMELDDEEIENDREDVDEDNSWGSSENESMSNNDDNDETGTWGSIEEKKKGWKTSYDIEYMSAEELDYILMTYNKMHPDRSPGVEIIKYANWLEAINKGQKNVIEELSNKVWYGECNTYLEVNERKAQMNNFNNLIGEHNSFRDEAIGNVKVIIKAYNEACDKNKELVQMHGDLVDSYNELVERYYNERKANEYREIRRNQSWYKSERGY